MSSITSRRGAVRPACRRASKDHARRTRFPDLSPQVQAPPDPLIALQWPSWTDRETIEAAVDPILWPEFRTRFTYIAPPESEGGPS